MGYAFLSVQKKVLLVTLIIVLPVISGCVVSDTVEKAKRFFEGPPSYEWSKMTYEGEFGWLDMVNANLSKEETHPVYIKNGTQYLNIYIKVEFSNPIVPDFELLSQGRLNLTIISPSGENVTKTYCTAAKSRIYEDYFTFETSGKEEQWNIMVKVMGYGKYKIVTQTYSPS